MTWLVVAQKSSAAANCSSLKLCGGSMRAGITIEVNGDE